MHNLIIGHKQQYFKSWNVIKNGEMYKYDVITVLLLFNVMT